MCCLLFGMSDLLSGYCMTKVLTYLQFTKEPVDGVLAHSVDLASVQSDSSIRFAVVSRHFLQTHQALPSLQQNTQDDETSLHVSLRHKDVHEYM